MNQITQVLRNIKPQTDKELWMYIKKFLHFAIPLRNVCEGHVSPFQFLADIFFERTFNAFGFASRGSGKTRNISIVHHLNCLFKPGCSITSVGAIEYQAKKCYQYLLEYISPGKLYHDCIRTSRIKDTIYKNNSQIEILPGTLNALNAPHPCKAFLDEVELVKRDIFEEFLNLAQGTEWINPQNILTSTRKWRHGIVQDILDEKKFQVYTWCIFEVAEKCTYQDCTQCKQWIQGVWDNETPRNFYDVCQQRLKKAEGFLPFHNVINRFLTLSRDTWESQQECLLPGKKNLVHKWFKEEQHVKEISYNPDLPLYEAIDWGGTNPFCCLWIQETSEPKILEIDELYISNIAPSTFAQMILERRAQKGYKVTATFGDPSGKDCILEFKKAGISVISTPAEVGVSVQEVIKFGENNQIYTDPQCKNLIAERKEYRWQEKKEGKNVSENPIKEFDHALDAERVYFINRFLKQSKEPSIYII
jgi:hypothetical protein